MINHGNIPFVVKALAVCGLILIAGCADAKRGFSNHDMDRFVAVMITQNCTATRDNEDFIQSETGFSKDKLRKITRYLRAEHLFLLNDDTYEMILINEGCP